MVSRWMAAGLSAVAVMGVAGAVSVAGVGPAQAQSISKQVDDIVDEYRTSVDVNKAPKAAKWDDLAKPDWAVNVYKDIRDSKAPDSKDYRDSQGTLDRRKVVAAVALEIALEDRSRCVRDKDGVCHPTGPTQTDGRAILALNYNNTIAGITAAQGKTNRQVASASLNSFGCGRTGKWTYKLFQYSDSTGGPCRTVSAYFKENGKIADSTVFYVGYYLRQALTIVLSDGNTDRYVELGQQGTASTSSKPAATSSAPAATSASTTASAPASPVNTAQASVDTAYNAYKAGPGPKPADKEAKDTAPAVALYQQIADGKIEADRDFYHKDEKKIVAALAFELAMTDRKSAGTTAGSGGTADGAAITIKRPNGQDDLIIRANKPATSSREEVSRLIDKTPHGDGLSWANLFRFVLKDDNKTINTHPVLVHPLKGSNIDWQAGYSPADFLKQALVIYYSGGKSTTQGKLSTPAPSTTYLPTAERYTAEYLFSPEDLKVVKDLNTLIEGKSTDFSALGHGTKNVNEATALRAKYYSMLTDKWMGHTIRVNQLKKDLQSDRQGTIDRLKQSGELRAWNVRSDGWNLRERAEVNDKTVIGTVNKGEIWIYQPKITYTHTVSKKKTETTVPAVALRGEGSGYEVKLDDLNNDKYIGSLWSFILTNDGKQGYIAAASFWQAVVK